jgi:hypothetical protein
VRPVQAAPYGPTCAAGRPCAVAAPTALGHARDLPARVLVGGAGGGVGLCGHGCGSPRFETAWRSGTLLGEALLARL